MTCIVGLAQDGKVYIGADSIATDGYCRHVTALRKVFRVGEFLIACAGSIRMAQIMQYHLEVRGQQDGETDERYMVVAFAEAVRTCQKDKGYAKGDDNYVKDSTMLVGYRGRIYKTESDFTINHFQSGILVSGAGEQYALGALLALRDLAPMERIMRALEISAELSAMVTPPFYVEVLE